MKKALALFFAFILIASVIGCIEPPGEETAERTSLPRRDGDSVIREEVLSKNDTALIKENLEQKFEKEGGFLENELKVYAIEYDMKENQLHITIDCQFEPMPSGEELAEFNKSWVREIKQTSPSISEKDFNIHLETITQQENGEHVKWGSTQYLYETGKYTFEEGSE